VDAATDSKYSQTYSLYGQRTVVVSLVPLVESQIRSRMFQIGQVASPMVKRVVLTQG